MKKQFYFLFMLLSLAATFTISGCKKDKSLPNNNIWGSAKQVDIAGRVLDETGTAISGATVKAGTTTATTDANGVFYITAASVYENLGYVNVSKVGYFMGSRSFLPRQGVNVVNIRMLAKNIIGSVSATSGGNVQAEGVSIAFTGGSFVKGGTAYTGQVSVALNYINPESQNFAEEMPGNLLGVQNESSSLLKSYGMVAVELTDGSGNEVKIASGSTATVNFPVPASLLSSAPAEIDLWSFDETNGYWKQEGKANLQNGIYVASVSHFSFWNCDGPFSTVMLNGRIVDVAGNGVQGARVTITSNVYGSETDYTSSTGYFGGYIPPGEVLNISVEVLCSNSGYVTVYTAQIGPLSSATTLAPITISYPSSTIVTGSVTDCNNNPLPSGYVLANGNIYFLTNGQFSFLACGTSVSITPYAYPVWAAGQPQSFTLAGGTYNAGTMQACNTGNNTGTVTDIDGNVYGTVQIGNQWWMQENLKTTRYQNGSTILDANDSLTWNSLTPAWCYSDGNAANNAIYGKLYNWYAVADPRNVCPTGWHVPSDAEFTQLTDYLGGESVAGGKMKAITLWNAPNTGADNSSGFTALPAGFRNDNASFGSVGFSGIFCCYPESQNNGAFVYSLSSGNSEAHYWDTSKSSGLSVRCVKD